MCSSCSQRVIMAPWLLKYSITNHCVEPRRTAWNKCLALFLIRLHEILKSLMKELIRVELGHAVQYLAYSRIVKRASLLSIFPDANGCSSLMEIDRASWRDGQTLRVSVALEETLDAIDLSLSERRTCVQRETLSQSHTPTASADTHHSRPAITIKTDEIDCFSCVASRNARRSCRWWLAHK